MSNRPISPPAPENSFDPAHAPSGAGPRGAASDNTLKAYARDWAHFSRWCRMTGANPLPPSPEQVGDYLTAMAAPADDRQSPAARCPLSVSTIERRLAGLVWNYARRGFALDRQDPEIATVLAGIGQGLRRAQNGFVRSYALSILGGVILVLAALTVVNL